MLYRHHARWLWCFALLIAAFAPVLCAQQTREEAALIADVEPWLRAPDQRQIPWHIKVMPPRLGFEMRQLVVVRATVPAKELQQASEQRQLVMVLRVADQAGRWLEPGQATHYELKQAIAKNSELEFSATLFLRPGQYTIAAVLYDDVLHQHNVAHLKVTMPPLKDDPLPGLDAKLPVAEFVDFEPWLTEYDSKPQLVLPVGSSHPLLVDVMINFSPSAQYTGRTWAYKNNLAVMLRTALVLSQLRAQNGCVRFTGLDVLGMKVLFDRIETDNIFWDRLVERARSVSSAVVDVSTLSAQKETASFFRDQLRRMIATSSDGCTSLLPDEHPDHVFIVAGSDMMFPRGNHVEGVDSSPQQCGCRVFFLHRQILIGQEFDELHRILKPLEPRSLSLDSPQDFRKSLAKIAADLQHAPGPFSANGDH